MDTLGNTMDNLGETIDNLGNTLGNTLEQAGMEELGQHVSSAGEIYRALRAYLREQLPAIIAYGIRVVLAILLFVLGRRFIRWVLKVVRRSMEKAGADTGVVQFIGSFLKFGLYTLLLFTIAEYLGVEETSVAALLGTAGVTVGLALQGGLANLAGGVMLLIFKPFQVGDYIIQSGQAGNEGTVSKIEICYTTLSTIDDRMIVIPNGTLSNSTIVNVTAKDQRKLDVKVMISYQSSIDEAKEIIWGLLEEDPDIMVNEDTIVFVDELASSGVVIGCRAWVETKVYWPAKWRLNQRIKEEFDANGIIIPYNQLVVHMQDRQDNSHRTDGRGDTARTDGRRNTVRTDYPGSTARMDSRGNAVRTDYPESTARTDSRGTTARTDHPESTARTDHRKNTK